MHGSCAEAARRLIQLYVNKASERLIPENERPLHDEVMSNMGNLWFRLLPRISKVSAPSSTMRGLSMHCSDASTRPCHALVGLGPDCSVAGACLVV